jgi:carboxymethylenebutenolidase
MCDQDQFEKDRLEYEARGLVTRRQFGVLLGAGMAMLLPKVVNAVAVTESEVTVMTPDGTADCYFVHPATGRQASSCGRISSGRPAFARCNGSPNQLFGPRGESVLPHQESPDCGEGAAADSDLRPPASALNETTHDRCEGVRGVADGRRRWRTGRSARGVLHGGPMAFRTAAAVPTASVHRASGRRT